MEVFSLTLNQMLAMFSFMLIGFFLKKKNILAENSSAILSRLETSIFLPSLIFNNMTNNCTVKNFIENYKLILYGFGFIVFAIIMSYPFAKLFVNKLDNSFSEIYKRNIYKYALTFGNYGFLGNYIVLGIWGSEVFFKYSMFTIPISFFTYTWGFYILSPKENTDDFRLKYIFKKLLNPTLIATVLGIFSGLLNLKRFIPSFLFTVLSNAGDCMGPVAMILAGIVISNYDIKELLSNKKVYFLTLLRLIIIPSIYMIPLLLFSVEKEIFCFVLFAFAAPIGLNTVVFPAAFGGDTKTGASMAMISHTFSVITIPLMYLIFAVIF